MEQNLKNNVSARHKAMASPPPPQELADAQLLVAQIILAEHNLFVRVNP